MPLLLLLLLLQQLRLLDKLYFLVFLFCRSISAALSVFRALILLFESRHCFVG